MVRKKTARSGSIDRLKEVLLVRRDALRQALAGDDSLLKELQAQQGGDVVDFAMDSASGELRSQLAEVESRELQSIENALRRMGEGSYGKCEACNCKIPMARLEVLPYATYCVGCKRMAEEYGIEPGNVVDWSVILDRDDLPFGDVDFKIS